MGALCEQLRYLDSLSTTAAARLRIMTREGLEPRSEPGPGTNPPPELVEELRIADGAEARRLADEQARVFWEVTEWQLQKSSNPGSQKDDPMSREPGEQTSKTHRARLTKR